MVDSRTLAQTVLKLATKPDAEKSIEQFMEYLTVNNLQGILPQIIAHIERITEQSAESNTLHIRSKFELSDTDVEHIQKLTGAESASVERHVDESIIGGFCATYKGFMYDGSLHNQLTRFKTMLTK
jgi:F0F1-type ATP synthase delta subunit